MKKEILGIPFHISNNDIIPNDISTYPAEIISIFQNQADFENKLYEFLMSNNYNIICWHATRLTEKEIIDIKTNGIDTDDEAGFFERKINNLPSEITFDIKQELLDYVKNIKETQSEGKVYASYGVFDLEDDLRGDKNFLDNWGGETIYNYYDKGFITNNDNRLSYIKQELKKVSFPCIVCSRINLSRLLETNCHFFDGFCYQLKNFDVSEIGGNLCTNKNNYKVIDVLKIKNVF